MKLKKDLSDLSAGVVIITGILPLLPGVKSLASACFLAIILIPLFLVLHAISSGSSHLLSPRPWRLSILFMAGVLIAVFEWALIFSDQAQELDLRPILPLFLISGIMRDRIASWKTSLDKGIHFDIRSLALPSFSAVAIIVFGLLREILSNGSLSLPGFGKASLVLSIPILSSFSSDIFLHSAGACLLAGYIALVLRLIMAKRAKPEARS